MPRPSEVRSIGGHKRRRAMRFVFLAPGTQLYQSIGGGVPHPGFPFVGGYVEVVMRGWARMAERRRLHASGLPKRADRSDTGRGSLADRGPRSTQVPGRTAQLAGGLAGPLHHLRDMLLELLAHWKPGLISPMRICLLLRLNSCKAGSMRRRNMWPDWPRKWNHAEWCKRRSGQCY